MDEVIWLRPERAGRGPAPEHSRAGITDAAVGLADAGGLAAASMRRVAEAAGTRPASLYRYVRNRDELLALMADRVAAEVVHPEPSGDPVADLVVVARGIVTAYLRHPWMLEIATAGVTPGPATVDHLESCLAILAPLDVPGRQKMEAIAMLTGAASLWVRQTLHSGDPASPERQAATVAMLTAAVADGRHPHLAAVLGQPGGTAAGEPDLFDRVVRGLVSGLLAPERQRDPAGGDA
jgi:AcrR family transcriptional regulator